MAAKKKTKTKTKTSGGSVNAAAVEAYFAGQPEAARRVLRRVRTIVGQVAPDAEARISYGIVGFEVAGRVALYLAGWKDHFAVYPATERLRATLGEALTPYLAAKGTLKFPYAQTMPTHLLQRIARELCAEARERSAAKKTAAKKKAVTKAPVKKTAALPAKKKTAKKKTAKKKTAKKTAR